MAASILIVHSDPAVLFGYVTRFTDPTLSDQFRVFSATSLEETLLKFEQQPIDVLISDLKVSGVDGMELAKLARSRFPNVRVFFIGDDTGPELQRRIKSVDAFGPLPKSVTAEEVNRLLEALPAPVPIQSDTAPAALITVAAAPRPVSPPSPDPVPPISTVVPVAVPMAESTPASAQPIFKVDFGATEPVAVQSLRPVVNVLVPYAEPNPAALTPSPQSPSVSNVPLTTPESDEDDAGESQSRPSKARRRAAKNRRRRTPAAGNPVVQAPIVVDGPGGSTIISYHTTPPPMQAIRSSGLQPSVKRMGSSARLISIGSGLRPAVNQSMQPQTGSGIMPAVNPQLRPMLSSGMMRAVNPQLLPTASSGMMSAVNPMLLPTTSSSMMPVVDKHRIFVNRVTRILMWCLFIMVALVVVGAMSGLGVYFFKQVATPDPVDVQSFIHIPAGDFLYQEGQRKITKDFWISKYEVTIGQYRQFWTAIQSGGDKPYAHPKQPNGKADHTPKDWDNILLAADGATTYQGQKLTEYCPIFNVDFYDAYAYAKWAGGRLPTEEEWEKAARGTTGRIYPWGNEFTTRDASRANTGADYNREGIKSGEIDGYYAWAPVDAHPDDISPYGVRDMAGNMAEWTDSWEAMASNAEVRVPVIRGGSWADQDVRLTQRRFNFLPDQTQMFIGFRIVTDLPPPGYR